jgi:hypothetical protein
MAGILSSTRTATDSFNLYRVASQTFGSEISFGKPARVFPTNTKYWGDFYSYDVTKTAAS